MEAGKQTILQKNKHFNDIWKQEKLAHT